MSHNSNNCKLCDNTLGSKVRAFSVPRFGVTDLDSNHSGEFYKSLLKKCLNFYSSWNFQMFRLLVVFNLLGKNLKINCSLFITEHKW